MPPHSFLADIFVLLVHFTVIPVVSARHDLPYLFKFWPDATLFIGAAPSNDKPGGQNFTYCCAKALNQFIANKHINTSSISVSPAFSTSAQFPCGATYQGNPTGAPSVQVSYRWCSSECPGFQISQSSKLTQWLQPFVGFILPAVVFALNVPRRRKLQLPDWVFPRDISDPIRFVGAVFCASVAALIVAFDTILWLLVVFAFAGPLLLSGLYEAWIDKRIVDYVFEKIENDHLPLPLRVRILVAILVGNLDQDTAWEPAMSVAASLELPDDLVADLKARMEKRQTLTRSMQDVQTRLRSMIACQYSFGSTIGAPIIFYIGSFIYAIVETKSQLGDNDTSHALAFGMWWMSIPHIAIVSGCLLAGNNPNTLEAMAPRPGAAPRATRPNWFRDHTIALRTQVDKMFGPTYDAKYKPAWMWDRGRSKRAWLLRVCREYSDQDPKHLLDLTKRLEMHFWDWTIVSTLAFLLFFIPCLFGFLTSYYTPQIGLSCRSLTFLLYAVSQTWLLLLWIWNFTWRDKDWRQRPRNEGRRVSVLVPGTPQEMVILEVVTTQTNSDVAATEQSSEDGETKTIQTLAAITGRATGSPSPENHAVTLMRNPLNDNIQSTTETTEARNRIRSILSILAKARWFPSRTEADAHSTEISSPRQPHIERLGFLLFWTLMALGFLGAIFSAIGGTMMQIMGVYRNCLCQINAQSWLYGKDEASLLLGTNTALDIRQAAHFWIPMGGAAAGFLGVVAYVAWWYQRRLRILFDILVGMVGENLPEAPVAMPVAVPDQVRETGQAADGAGIQGNFANGPHGAMEELNEGPIRTNTV